MYNTYMCVYRCIWVNCDQTWFLSGYSEYCWDSVTTIAWCSTGLHGGMDAEGTIASNAEGLER